MGADYTADKDGKFKLVIIADNLKPNEDIYLDIDLGNDELEIILEKGNHR